MLWPPYYKIFESILLLSSSCLDILIPYFARIRRAASITILLTATVWRLLEAVLEQKTSPKSLRINLEIKEGI